MDEDTDIQAVYYPNWNNFIAKIGLQDIYVNYGYECYENELTEYCNSHDIQLFELPWKPNSKGGYILRFKTPKEKLKFLLENS